MTRAVPQAVADRGQFLTTEHLKADLKVRSVRGGAATLVGQGTNFLIHTASSVILARLLTPADFGLIAMVTAVTGFAHLFKDLGLSMATVQKAEITHEQVSVLFWINVAMSLLIAGITMVLAPVIAWFYGEPRLTLVGITLSLTFVFGGLTVQHQALLRRQMRFTVLAIIPIVSAIFAVMAAILSVALGAGYWALVVMELTRSATYATAVRLACRWRPSLPTRGASVRGMLYFGVSVTGFNIINYLVQNVDHILIGRVCGPASLGLYTKAYGLLTLPARQVTAPITQVAVPLLSRFQSKPEDFRRIYRRGLLMLVFITMPLVTFAWVHARALVLLVLGDQWLKAVPIFYALSPATVVLGSTAAVGWVFIALGRVNQQFRWGLFAGAVRIVGFLVAVQWGPTAVAWAYSGTTCALYLPALVYCFRGTYMRLPDVYGAIAQPLGYSIAAALVALLFRQVVDPRTASTELLTGSVVFCLAYAGSWLLTRRGRRTLAEVIETVSWLRNSTRPVG